MEKFAPTPEPEIPQYQGSLTEARHGQFRDQNSGKFASSDEVNAATEGYMQEKAAWDEQEAERTRVYENLAALPEDLDPAELTASDIQQIAGISYKQAYELQSLGGNGFADVLKSAREWKAEQSKNAERAETPAGVEVRSFVDKHGKTRYQKSGVNPETRHKYTSFISEEEATERGFKATETDGLLEELPEFIQENVVRKPASVESPSDEPNEEQLKRNLRGLLSNYRMHKVGLLPHAIEESKEEIFAAFEQLKAKTGWEGDELLAAQGQLFREMGESTPFETSLPANIVPEGEVEDIANGRSKAETMDDAIRILSGAKSSGLKPEVTNEQVAKVTEEKLDQFVSSESDGSLSKLEEDGRFRRFGRKVLEKLFTLRSDRELAEAEQADANKPVATTTAAKRFGQKQQPQKRTDLVQKPQGRGVRINAEQASQAPERVRKLATEADDENEEEQVA